MRPWLVSLTRDALAVTVTIGTLYLVGCAVLLAQLSGDPSTTGFSCGPNDAQALSATFLRSPTTRLVYSAIGGGASGGMVSILCVVAILRMVESNKPRASHGATNNLLAAAVVLAEMCIYYWATAAGAFTFSCSSAGGANSQAAEKRYTFSPAFFLYWAASASSMSFILGAVSGHRMLGVWPGVFMTFASAFGVAAVSTVDNPSQYWVLSIFALVSAATSLATLTRILLVARNAAAAGSTRTVLALLGPVLVVLWGAYIALQFLRSSSVILQPFVIYFDVVIKVLFFTQIFASDYSRRDEESNAMLERLDKARRAAEEANTAKREVVKYLFHELRVPLNSITLAVEDLRCSAQSTAAHSVRESIGGGGSGLQLQSVSSIEILDIMKSSTASMAHLLGERVRERGWE